MGKIIYYLITLLPLMPYLNGMDPMWYEKSDSDTTTNQTSFFTENKPYFLTIDANNTENSDQSNQTNLTEYEGRSAKSMNLDKLVENYSNRDREARIINDEKLSIKGFIPIVGFGNDKHDTDTDSNGDSQDKPLSAQDYPMDIQRFADAYKQYAQSSNIQQQQQHSKHQHVAGPEDQRFIGAALQNLANSFGKKPTRKQSFHSGFESAYPGPNSLASIVNGGSFGGGSIGGGGGGFGGNIGGGGGGGGGECVCVPFYMCKNGYLAEAKSNSGQIKSSSNNNNNNLLSAQSVLKQFAVPAPKPIRQYQRKPAATAVVQQNPYEQYLPLDERSTDDLLGVASDQSESYQSQSSAAMEAAVNNTAPQYADEVLARMLGVRSDGCGVLRTCCRAQPLSPELELPEFALAGPIDYPNGGQFSGGQDLEFNKRFTSPYQPNIQQIPEYSKPFGSHKYEFPQTQRPHHHQQHHQQQQHHHQVEAYPSQVVQASYDFLPKPLNPNHHGFAPIPSRPIAPQIPVPLKPTYNPSIRPEQTGYQQIQPLKPGTIYPTYGSQGPVGHSLDSIDGGSGHCGKRPAVGIHGRVQNLQYQDSATEFGEFPWHVAILKKLGPADSLYVCGGAIVSPYFVVTAAHCLKKFTAHDLKVRIGEWDVHREDEFYPHIERFIDDIIVHPDFFAGSLLNDAALIKLDSPIDFRQSPHIGPVCLPEAYENFAGQRCFVSGWGKNAFGHQGEFQSVLTKVDVPVVTHGECEQALRRTRLGYGYHLHPSMVCAGGEPGKDACDGDGGSALVCETRGGIFKAVGLVSWGIGCGTPGIPGVYTNLAQLRPWIDSYIQRFGGHSPVFGSIGSVGSIGSNSFEQQQQGFGGIDERSFGGSTANQNNSTTATVEDLKLEDNSDLNNNSNTTHTIVEHN